jgi:outer membrane protein assembly factor BamB
MPVLRRVILPVCVLALAAGALGADGDRIDRGRMELGDRQLGLTLLVELERDQGNSGRVLEVDRAGRVLWRIDKLTYPIDAQVIGPDRVLIAEYCGSRLTECNFKGEVLWQRPARAIYLGARRLPNGNTFLVLRNELLEIDRAGREVRSVKHGDVAAATPLSDGRIALATAAGKFVLLDAKGQEVRSFRLGGRLQPTGATLEVLPNGHVLVPLTSAGKVVECDGEGKTVWEAPFPTPTSARRLPGGNTLIASREAGLVAEIDRTGKEVWRYQPDGRPLRASRR